jgi:sulfoxide reductase heme-binding subunit YedZ
MNGWRLVGTLSLVLSAMTLALMASHGWDIEGVRVAIRATARTSLVLFALAFTAGAMVELLPSEATRWQRVRTPLDSVMISTG